MQFLSRFQKQQAGVSLTELCVTLAITAILLGQAIGSYRANVQKRRLLLVTAALGSDLRSAHEQAMRSLKKVRVHSAQIGDDSCYIIHDGPKGACQCAAKGQIICTGGAQVFKSVWLPATQQVKLSANSSDILINPGHGTVTPALTVKLHDDDGDMATWRSRSSPSSAGCAVAR